MTRRKTPTEKRLARLSRRLTRLVTYDGMTDATWVAVARLLVAATAAARAGDTDTAEETLDAAEAILAGQEEKAAA